MATFDPLEGVTPRTTKEDLMDRLRRAGTELRKSDRRRKAALQEVEERIKAKATNQPETLRQVIVSATESEWKESIEFLEEFEDPKDGTTLLPTPLQRLVVGGHVLLGHHEAAG
jgi:hypothetical protein